MGLDAVSNSIALPERSGIHTKRTVHNGMHTQDYTERFRGLFSLISSDLKMGRITPAQAGDLINKEVARARKELREGDLELNAASRKAKNDKTPSKEKSDTDDNSGTTGENETDSP